MSQQPWWARAATLTERLDALAAGGISGARSGAGDEHFALAAQVARRWRAVVNGRDGARDPGRFERRLAALGLTVDALPDLVAVDVPAPAWLTTVHAVGDRSAATARSIALDDEVEWADDSHVPFSTLWRPWVEHATAAVAARTSVGAREAAAVTESLRAELVDVGAAGALAVLDKDLGCERRRAGAAAYRDWVTVQLADGGHRLFEELPVLGRVLAVATEQWIDVVVEMLGRRDADRSDLVRLLGFGDEPIVAVRAAGDTHHDGRRVMVLTDAAGQRVVYKPRSLGPEVAVRRVVDRFRTIGAIDVEVVPDCIARDDYGWMRHVTGRPAADDHERELLGRRAGAVTMLARTLGISDLHDENVIVDGSVPWLVDLECVAHPSFADSDQDEVSLHGDSILSTSLLPLAAFGDRGLDVAGFTAVPGDRQYRRVGRWVDLGLGSIGRPPIVQPGIRADARVPFDVTAFELGMADVAACAPHLTGEMVAAVSSIERRLIPDATWLYGDALDRSVQGPALVHGLLSSIEADVVAGECYALDADGRSRCAPWRRALAEPIRVALERLEIPRLLGTTDGTGAHLDGVAVDHVTVESGIELIARRAASLDAGSVATQRAVLRLALEQRFGTHDDLDPLGATPLDASSSLFDLCRSLGAELVDTVTTDRLGRVQWIHAATHGETQSAEFCGAGLYDGAAGIAVFLASLAVAGDTAAEPLARRALRTAVDVRQMPGLAGGAAGVAWAAAIVGALLDDRTLAADARRLIVDATWNEFDPTDLLAGRGGVLLSAAAIAETTGDAAVADLAAAHRRALELEWRAVDRRDPLGRTTARRLGVAHGITGVALAVARSLALDGDVDGSAWLDELIERENERIAARDGVPARIVEADGARRPDLGWCWGASGVAAARQAIAEVRPTDAVMQPITRARELVAAEVLPTARACCGVTSQLRALPIGEPAADRLLDVLRGPRLRFERGSLHRNPGLWRGISGVGLELLRRCGTGPVPDPLTLAPLPRTSSGFGIATSSHITSVRRPDMALVPTGANT